MVLTLRELVTIGLLRSGDTHAARHLKVCLAESGSAGTALVREVARRTYRDHAEADRQVARASAAAGSALARTGRLGYRTLSILDPAYPPQLAEIVDPPPVLWVAGDLAVLSETIVGVVGARKAAPVSLLTAKSLAIDLASAGLVVASGLARGVDGVAHRGALEAGGLTIAVMGSGLDVVYPAEHRQLARQIGDQGAVVTEFPPGTPPYSRHFPLRNRIISGLSRAVVVVEASDKSGSLITARMALDQGREVLAVPGSTLSGSHKGSHRLIKDGATLVETVGDVLQEIRWTAVPVRPAGRMGDPEPGSLEAAMQPGEPYSVDDLVSGTGRSMPDVLAGLGELELAGRVARSAGGQYTRLPSRAAAAGE